MTVQHVEVPGERTMKILIVSPQFRPIIGGYERAAERLAGALARRGCLVTVLAERRDGSWASSEARDGYEIQRIWCVFRAGLHLLTTVLSHVAWLFRNGRRFDLWYVQQYGTIATVAIVVGRMLGKPTILKLTSSRSQGISNAVAALPFGIMQARAHRCASACIAVSRETVDEARHFGFLEERIVQIPNGVDAVTFQPAEPIEKARIRRQLGLPEGHVALYVGRLSDEKDPLGLLHAWAMARGAMIPGWILVVVGDGPLKEECARTAERLGISGHIILAGARREIQDWYRAADLHVLFSRHEGMSNTTLEAMAAGLPSVVPAVAGMRELVMETGSGLVVDIGDRRAFADAVAALGNDEERRIAMGISARAAVARSFSIDAVADFHLRLYSQLLAAMASGSRRCW